MKKIIYITLIALTVGVVSCNKNKIQPQPISENSINNLENSNQREEAFKPKIKIRHTGRIDQFPPPPPCSKPLGICITFGIQAQLASIPFTKEEIAEGVATAELNLMDKHHLKFIPSRTFALPDGTIEIEENGFIAEELANQLGYKKIKIKKGVYPVNPNEGAFGSVIIDINAINPNHN